MPTLKDLIKRHEERFVEEIKEKIENDDLKKEVNLINVLMSEDISPVDIAAALLKYYNENNKLNNHEKLIDVDIKRNKKTSNKDSNIEFSKNKKSKLNVKNSSRMYINIGSRKGVSQKHIVCALCKDANIDSKDIGDIEIFDKFSFVNISKNKIKEAINRLNGKHIKGFKVLVEIANEKQDSLKKQSKDKKHKKDNKKRK